MAATASGAAACGDYDYEDAKDSGDDCLPATADEDEAAEVEESRGVPPSPGRSLGLLQGRVSPIQSPSRKARETPSSIVEESDRAAPPVSSTPFLSMSMRMRAPPPPAARQRGGEDEDAVLQKELRTSVQLRAPAGVASLMTSYGDDGFMPEAEDEAKGEGPAAMRQTQSAKYDDDDDGFDEATREQEQEQEAAKVDAREQELLRTVAAFGQAVLDRGMHEFECGDGASLAEEEAEAEYADEGFDEA